MDCIFCRIAAGTIPSEMVFEDEKLIVFKDINPAAKVHLLVVPRRHIPAAADITEEHGPLLGHMWVKIPQIARQLGVSEAFRVITNSGKGAGQAVDHLHFHLMSDMG